MRRFLKMVKNANIFQSGEKCRDFSKWSCCNGRPARMKILEVVRNARISQNGLIVMGNRSKNGRTFKVVRNARISQNGFIVMGNRPKWKTFEGGEKCKDFSKWFHCYGQPTQMEKI